MSGGTQIDELLNDINSNKLNGDENSMVDSIINDLNGGGGNQSAPPQLNSQQQMPQITPEEKDLIMKQQLADQQRMIQQQQMAQQQQQMAQQQQMPPQVVVSETDYFKNLLHKFKDTIVVLFLTILFNLDSVSESMKFKDYSILYDIQTGKSTFLSILIKSIVIATLFYIIQVFMN